METECRLEPVQPVQPAAPYIGGKRGLFKRLSKVIESIPHTTYAEPFVGMGGVFFRRHLRPRAEIINDINRDIATLFRILQRHYPQFLDTIRFQITSRVEFERLAKTDPDTLTDLERAARFLYLQRTSFGGKVMGQSFGVSPGRPGRINLMQLEPMLEALHERLAGVIIECLPWPAFIQRYDRPGTLFYCDPPYWGNETDYGRDVFSREDFTALADILRQIKGHFVLSINDVPEIRKLFAWANIEEVQTTYSISRQTTKRASELIITSTTPR